MADDPGSSRKTHTKKGISIGPDDWPEQAADKVVDIVDKVKGYTTDNALLVIRGVVYGLVALVLGTIALILTVAIMVRLADAYLPIGSGVGDATWSAHLFIGSLLTILGLGAWGSRSGEGSPRKLLLAGAIDLVIITSVVVVAVVNAFV